MEKYVLVVLPPKDVANFVDAFRQKYGRYTQYKIPPHITIYPPFHNFSPSEGSLRGSLADALATAKPQRIAVRGIETFRGDNNVVYLEPEEASKKYLVDLAQRAETALGGKVQNAFKDYGFSIDKFTPHLTIAERVPDKELWRIETSLRQENIRVAFLVNALFLFKKTDDDLEWRLKTEIKFQRATT